jgi:FKBP-type peptidyl-prolyl cis-trans isomerase 2
MSSHGSTSGPTATGELVLLDYELWAEGGGRTELVDTTREEVAEKAGAKPHEGATFGPHPHLIGGDFFPAGIENALTGLPVGEEVVKEFEPAEAFGERDPKLIELFGMHEIERLPEMRREDAHLDLGTVLTIKGRRGRVVSLTRARVRVDFNPAFSGQKVRGTFKVLGRISEPAEQVRALVELSYGRSKDFHIEVKGGHITLKVPDRAKFDFGWLASKPRLIERIRSQMKPEKITITEEFVTPSKKEGETEKEAAPASESAPAPVDAAEKPAKAPKAAKKAAAEPSPTE